MRGFGLVPELTDGKVELRKIPRTDRRLLRNMVGHYSEPQGFVGRSICYAVLVNEVFYGTTVAGSATLHLPGRNEFHGILRERDDLRSIANNIFFHVEKVKGEYPLRNFTTEVIKRWREVVQRDWKAKYGDEIKGWETLVELPRTGECYLRDGWTVTGTTKGQTCKRVAGHGTDSWSGKRVWDTENLRPKLVLCRRI